MRDGRESCVEWPPTSSLSSPGDFEVKGKELRIKKRLGEGRSWEWEELRVFRKLGFNLP